MNKRYNITIAILLFVAVILISSLNTPEKDYHEEIKDVSLTFSNEKWQKISLDYDNKQLKYEIKKEVKKKEDNKFYKVKFLNNIYDIEKEGFKRKEKQQKEEYKNKISILNYSNVTDINHIESHFKKF